MAGPVEQVRSRAENALRSSPFYELRVINVEPMEKGLMISGRVSSFYYKQLAQEAVRSVCPDTEVQLFNSIDVR